MRSVEHGSTIGLDAGSKHHPHDLRCWSQTNALKKKLSAIYLAHLKEKDYHGVGGRRGGGGLDEVGFGGNDCDGVVCLWVCVKSTHQKQVQWDPEHQADVGSCLGQIVWR